MQKLLNKITALIITLMLASGSIMPAIAYATNSEQTAKTSEENVEFNATINGGYNATLNLDLGGTLDLNIKVSNTGYLKNAKVTLEDNNYQIDNTIIEGIKSINENVIELNEVNTGEMLNVSVPIRLTKEERISSNFFGRDSKVTLEAIYVNENGKERKINKSLTQHVEWTSKLQEVVSQSLIRYIKFGNNKTMVSFKINEGLENNKMPAENKEILINVPTLEGNKPSSVVVTGDGISYTYENDVITIKKENTPDSEGKIKWDSQDEYVVTYIYDVQVEESKLVSQVVAKSRVKGQSIEGSADESTYSVKEKIGEYVEAEASGTDEINKGYIYTNLKKRENNLETAFEVRLKANTGYKDVVDSIKVEEKPSMFNNSNAGNSILTKNVKVSRDDLINILGESGTIKVFDQSGAELGTLSKDTTELKVNVANVSMQTSSIQNDGNIEFVLEKAITANMPWSKQQVKGFTQLTTNAVVSGYKGDELCSSKQISKVANLQEPTSNAKLDVNVKNLSTVVDNEDVIVTATLKTTDISDALYTNARVNIVFPKEVKKITIKEAGLIYENELVLNNLTTNNNVISLQLDGTQTGYGSQATAEGTVIRIVANVTLDNLAPTTDEVIAFNYSNADTGEINSVTANVKIVAPTGFVTTNTLEVNGQSVTAQEGSEKISKIDANAGANEVELSGFIVNNLGRPASGVTVLGKIPSSGNKDANDVDLGSNFDTQLTSPINVKGLDADVFYSDNANETIDGGSWTTDYTPSAKAYKISAKGDIEQIASMSFDYSVKVPENLQYGKTSKSTYAVYYNNNAELGQNKNYVLAKAVGISTGELPKVVLEPEIIETNSGARVQNDAQVKESKLLTYKLNVKNTGNEIANNIKVKVDLPAGLAIVKDVEDITGLVYHEYDRETKNYVANIESLNAGETKTFDIRLIVTQKVEEAESEDLDQKITAELTADKINETVKSETTIKITKGDLSVYATADKENKSVKPQDKLEYYFEISNANNEKKYNVKATIKIPSEFNVDEIGNNGESECRFDEASSTITYTKASLDPGEIVGVLLNLSVGELGQNKTEAITGEVRCDGMESGEPINPISYNLTKDLISASLSSNISEGTIGDTDNLEYYINLTNNSDEAVDIGIKDTIPTELRVTGYEIQDAKGTTQSETSARTIFVGARIDARKTARLTIRTIPYALQKGITLNIENNATVMYGGNTVTTNTLKHIISGTSSQSAGSSGPQGQPSNNGSNGNNQNGNNQNSNINDNGFAGDGAYTIRGTAWIDANSNGVKEASEEKASGLTVKLFYVNAEGKAVETNGNNFVATTNDAGDYAFVSVAPGEYIVVADIDGQSYGVAPYKANGVSDSENSDFVTSKLFGKEVAATDVIQVGNANIYNIDLGLAKNRRFDLDIRKTVSRITVSNTKDKTKTYDFDNANIAKVELASANVKFATVLVEYNIIIENKGEVSGYAKSIADYIPEGMTFSSELNNSWYLGQDGNAYNTSLANTLINPGETKTLKLVLSRKMTGDNTGTVRNTSEILTSYNEYGLTDIDTASGISKDAGADKSSVDTIIAMRTGKEIASFTGIALGILAILAIALYEIKKHVINKMYNFIERS